MDRLRTGELRQLLDTIRALYAAQTLDHFRATGMHAIARLIPCESTGYAEMDPSRRQSKLWASPREFYEQIQQLRETWEHHMPAHPAIAHFKRTGNGDARTLRDFGQRFWDSALYSEVYRPVRMTGWMGALIPGPPPLIMGASVHREGRKFSERERLLLNLLRPHIVQGYLNARGVSRLQAELTLLRSAYEDLQQGVITLRGTDRIATASPAARRWIAQYFSGHERDVRRLPEELRGWVVRECRRLTMADDAPGPCLPLTVERDGARLRVRLIPGAEQHVLLLAEERRGPTPASLAHLGLTRREAEVLAWVAEGKTNAEIATILGARPKTVGKHLERIFEKLGVETRTAAARVATTAQEWSSTRRPP
jgi:DNA-binding CsgD family transcriptional regulator/GAF domain-containing protein